MVTTTYHTRFFIDKPYRWRSDLQKKTEDNTYTWERKKEEREWKKRKRERGGGREITHWPEWSYYWWHWSSGISVGQWRCTGSLSPPSPHHKDSEHWNRDNTGSQQEWGCTILIWVLFRSFVRRGKGNNYSSTFLSSARDIIVLINLGACSSSNIFNQRTR